MNDTIRTILLVLAVICFAIGALIGLFDGTSKINWTNAGLAFAAASFIP